MQANNDRSVNADAAVIKTELAFEHYCGPNSMRVRVGAFQVWYSYSTPVAFMSDDGALTVRVNDWSQVTGKHLNTIDGGSAEARKRRLDSETFEARLASELRRLS